MLIPRAAYHLKLEMITFRRSTAVPAARSRWMRAPFSSWIAS